MTNGDGGISAEEMIAAAGQRAEDRAAQMIERFDENGDGILQLEEMPQRGEDRAGRMFERVDADDGNHGQGERLRRFQMKLNVDQRGIVGVTNQPDRAQIAPGVLVDGATAFFAGAMMRFIIEFLPQGALLCSKVLLEGIPTESLTPHNPNRQQYSARNSRDFFDAASDKGIQVTGTDIFQNTQQQPGQQRPRQ